MRFTLAFLLAAPLAALGESPFTSLHPEEAYPDPQPRVFGAKTQAALAQFQLSRAIPASGQLDDPTLAELGLQRTPTDAAAGASAPQQSEAPPPQAPQPAASPEPANAASPPAKPGS